MTFRKAIIIVWILVSQAVAYGQTENPQASPSEDDPFSIVLKRSLSADDRQRLVKLTAAEFEVAVERLEKNPEGPIAIRYVWLVARNFNRLASEISPDLMDRAAAALVKETDIEDVNLRLQNLNTLEGVNHRQIKVLAQKLSASDDEYTSLQAKKNLEILRGLPEQASPSEVKGGFPRNAPGEPPKSSDPAQDTAPVGGQDQAKKSKSSDSGTAGRDEMKEAPDRLRLSLSIGSVVLLVLGFIVVVKRGSKRRGSH